MRNAERQTELYQRRVVPAAQVLVSSSQNAYAAGAVGFADLIDSERMLISIRRMVAQAQIEREKRLVELKALAGVEIETLGRPEKDLGDAGGEPSCAIDWPYPQQELSSCRQSNTEF